MPSLSTYRSKRHANATPEPGVPESGAEDTSSAADLSWAPAGRRFVVQKHDASRLHYDLRLEHDGALLSWAVPKGPSMKPSRKALAVQVEDHPLDYADFEGTIPKGEYGGGTVMVWDRGRYAPIGADDLGRMHRAGRMKFALHGDKLSGAFALVRMNGKQGDGGKNWLLIKDRDDAAHDGQAVDITDERTRSVKSGRTLEEIAAGDDAAALVPLALDLPSRAKPAPMPTNVKPLLATLVDDAPEGGAWLHEIKFDGYRGLVLCENGQVRILTRNGRDWTERFAALANAMARLPATSAIVDGEVVALQPDGTTSFQELQNALRSGQVVHYFAFDLLYVNGHDLRECPLTERKALLKQLIDRGYPDGQQTVRYSDHQRGRGEPFLSHACDVGVEGVISKRADSRYIPGRSRAWTKTKCNKRQEFVIVGWTDPRGSRSGFGSLLLGYHDADGVLQYAGRVGAGFSDDALETIRTRLDDLASDKSPVTDPPRREQREAHWVQPRLVGEVTFTGWTDDGALRHPVFEGLREDKRPQDVHREHEQPNARVTEQGDEKTKKAAPRQARGGNTKTAKDSTKKPGAAQTPKVVAGVTLSNADRVLYPEQGGTKADLARYYEAVAEHMLPHLQDRPIAVVRCPRGQSSKCFFQKHRTEGLPDAIRSIDVAESGEKPQPYLTVDDLPGLVSLVQIGVLEIHPWGSLGDRLDRPDRLIFDLDPGPDVPWSQVKSAAMLVRDALEQIDLQSFVKTTGGKGLHVVVPIRRTISWETAKQFTRAIASAIAADQPSRYVAVMTKSKRTGKVFIDYLRNGRDATAVAAYSTRARPGAPVAAPIRWDELPDLEASNQYTIANLPQRLARRQADPWAEMGTLNQTVKKSVLTMLKVDAR